MRPPTYSTRVWYFLKRNELRQGQLSIRRSTHPHPRHAVLALLALRDDLVAAEVVAVGHDHVVLAHVHLLGRGEEPGAGALLLPDAHVVAADCEA
jgi:hypothetical protein